MSESLWIDFPTSASPKGDEAIRGIIRDSVDTILGELGPGVLVSIILSGAMTQGEGTVLEHRDGRHTVLSDIDLYLVVRPGEDMRRLKGQASRMARDLRTRPSNEHMASSFDLAAVTVDEIAAAKPRIGTVDLRNRGRVIWGTDVLSDLPPLDPALIPPGNAVTLILNRITEELHHRRADHPRAIEMGMYHSAKTGADLALAILVLLGEYRPTYRERAIVLESIWDDTRLQPLRRRAPDLPGKVARWTAQKLCPDFESLALEVGGDTPQEVAERLWLSLVPPVEAVWTWAVEFSYGKRYDDPAAIAEEIGRMEGSRERLRGWREAWRRGDVGRGPGSLLRAGLGVLRGSPVSLLYGAVSLVYFSSPGRNGLASAGRTTEEYLKRARRLMPIPPPARMDWDDTRRALVDYWRDTVMRGMR